MKNYNFKFPNKFSGNQLDNFVDGFYKFYSVNKNDGYYEFDLSEVEWMSNQEMLVLTAIFKYLVEEDAKFKVFFLKNGSTANIDRRVVNQISQIWNVWKIYKIAPEGEFHKYFDIHGNIVRDLERRFSIKQNNSEIYNRYGITPFITLESIANYDNRIIGEMLSETYSLSKATNEVLRLHSCNMPFENHTLSSIITKELYENFLDHVSQSIFTQSPKYAFLSLSLVPKLRKMEENKIQAILSKNFTEESSPELKNFYYDEHSKKFLNQSILQFSFLDFGPGIVSTLREEYNRRNSGVTEIQTKEKVDSEILKLAFQYDSSKDPLDKRYLDKTVIPRGLYDLLSIVRRFNGLVIARSNYGKIFFDFSNTSEQFQDANVFGDHSNFFPGTLITIFIPERSSIQKFDTSKISVPNISRFKHKEPLTANYINLYEFLKSVDDGNITKGEIYSKLFDSIVKEISRNGNKGKIHYFDFSGFNIDERITKKIIHFLISDYNVNSENNIVVLNPPPDEFLENLNNEILQLNLHVESYRLHPIPFIKEIEGGIDIFWMGVYNKQDAKKLNDLLLEQNDLRRSDFEDPNAVTGNINFYDFHGNLHSYISVDEIRNYFEKRNEDSTSDTVQSIISKYIIRKNDRVFLCPGNYYQHEYLQLYDAISNSEECKILAAALQMEINRHLEISKTLKFICVTSSSQQIVKQFKFEIGQKPNIIYLDNYHSVIYDSSISDLINKDDKVVIICDLFSTGYLTNIICNRLNEIGARLEKIAVLVDAMDEDFEPETVIEEVRKKVISVVKMKMTKFRRKSISDKLANNEIQVLRVNPYTNTPIMESLKENSMADRVLMENDEFIRIIDESQVKAGYFKFNNLIHPYFFDMGGVLQNLSTAKELFLNLFTKLKGKLSQEVDLIFYPKGSAIQQLDFEILRSEIFKNHAITIAELERFSTNEGWRFPHPPKYMYGLTTGKRALIIDDGSCSGDSLMQMIDEIAALKVKEIFVLSIIGRLNDHKKDFFTRLNTITGKAGVIPVHVFFGVQWHIPTYYIEESPIIREKQWLENVFQIPNLPGRIKSIANNILIELSLKDITDESNRYLLKRKDDISIIKELILVKEEIGKITSYRYYTEYFEFFDKFIQRYEGKEATDRTKMIESICAVFLHEPELYSKVKTVLPDVTEKIEIFVQTILFGNPERDDRKKLSKNDLYYKWSNKNIIHLFFIVFSGRTLFDKLTTNRLETIIKDFVAKESDLYYIFYRLLKYLPINPADQNKKPFSGTVKHLIEVLKESSDINPDTKRHLKRFSIFISSLPSHEENFLDALANMKNAYGRVIDDAFHNEYIYNDKQIVASQLRLLSKFKTDGKPTSEILTVIHRHWSNISQFVANLLNFYNSYRSYFFTHNYINDNTSGKKSLADLVGLVDDAIYNEEFSNVELLIETINEFFHKFILDGSETNKLFSNITVENIGTEFEKFKSMLSTIYPSLTININSSLPSSRINIPQLYLREVIFKELASNFRYADEEKGIRLKLEEVNNWVIITISNDIKSISENGGGQGLNKLSLINSLPIDTFYEARKENEKFIQTIKLSKI
ncbi:phosphoribosyltransferase [Pedobacter sp. UBA4863]|uniref:phosphoribosyltransferase n=1 Tax=Pedobacter sp. UBA4863 TaxID=1947060 RepID=UPI0025EA13ED|nr:phosphoribosyltransferase [Pedobacter sp. UBA4863]